MQIPNIPFLSGPGFLREPQPGTRQQVNSELQVKAKAQRAPAGPGATGVSAANSLDEAVRSLAADGRLPRRGSLIDLKA